MNERKPTQEELDELRKRGVEIGKPEPLDGGIAPPPGPPPPPPPPPGGPGVPE
jgi:hypothetical protein